ncbi:hypothetical protein RQP46_000760 [Phenoliferia psychrophenolica]
MARAQSEMSETPGARGSRSPSLFPSTPEGDTPDREPTPGITTLPNEVEEAQGEARVSFYLQAVDEMVEGSFKEAHLFNPAELDAIARFRQLDGEARYLFIRLYLRKHDFIRVRTIGYERDISDVDAACSALCSRTPTAGPSSVIDLTADSDDEDKPMAGQSSPEDDQDFSRLAFDEKSLLDGSPADLLKLLNKDEIVSLGMKMKVLKGNGSRRDVTAALLKTSNQATLSFAPVSSKKGKEKASVGLKYDERGNKAQQSSVVVTHVLKILGCCIRLSPSYISLFDRLSLVYHRTCYTSSTGTTSLTASLLARFGKRRYPSYEVKRSYNLWPNRDALIDFEVALAAEREIEQLVETKFRALPKPDSDQTKKPKKGGKEPKEKKEKSKAQLKIEEDRKKEQEAVWQRGLDIFERVEPTWKKSVKAAKKEDANEPDEEKKGLLYYRKRFDPGWPLTRVLYKASALYARIDRHDDEKNILRKLIAQTMFRRGKRGAWYDRLALVLVKYPSAKENNSDLSKREKLKLANERNAEALQVCRDGLKDPYTHLVYKSGLQARIKRIESLQKVDKDEREKFDEQVCKADKKIVIGERLDDPETGKHSVWKSKNNPDEGISVEELVMEYYENEEGLKGIHSESGILTTLFGLLFWSILFTPVDGVFETPWQSAPLDLATDAFFAVRKKLIEKRLKFIANAKHSKIAELLSVVDDQERPHGTYCIGVNWDKYSKTDLLEITKCIGGESLSTIMRVFAEDYTSRCGGVPDLILWDPEDERALFVEVKGPGDRLSNTQKVWIDVLGSAGVEVVVCAVMTEDDKEKLDEKAAERKGNSMEKKKRKQMDSDSD